VKVIILEQKKEENIRFSEKFLLFGLSAKQIEKMLKSDDFDTKKVEIVISDENGEPTVELISPEQRHLTKIRKKFLTVFADHILFAPNRTLAEAFFETLDKKGFQVSTAESVTGGMIASRILDQPGASKILKEAFVVYSNKAKIDLLGINPETIEKNGVVSPAVAAEMAERLQKISEANVTIATTGIAGPDGGTKEIPVGTVFFGFLIDGKQKIEKRTFLGDRNEIRKKASAYALAYVIDFLKTK